jgi:hypothetical protein
MIIARAGCRNGYTVVNLEDEEEEKRKARRSKTLLPPVLRSDEPALSPEIQQSEVSRVALLSRMLPRDSPIPQDATEIPAMRAFDSDLHDKPKLERPLTTSL